jgi:hypothetical protein
VKKSVKSVKSVASFSFGISNGQSYNLLLCETLWDFGKLCEII